MKKLAFFGVGIFSETIEASLYCETNIAPNIYVVEDNYYNKDKHNNKQVIKLSDIKNFCNTEEYEFVIAIGYTNLNRQREKIANKLRNLGYKIFTFISNRANISRHAIIGEGAIIFEGSTVHHYAELKKDIIIFPGVYIGHHAKIASSCYFGPNACICSMVNIGERCFIGANSVIREHVNIGSDCIVGAGSVLMKNIPINTLCNAGESNIYIGKADKIDLTSPQVLRYI